MSLRNTDEIGMWYIIIIWASDPIPGGCNMEFSVEIAPYLITSFTESVIIVDSQPASAPVPRDRAPVVCESQQVHHEMYHMFLTERDFTCDSYFGALLKMMTVQDVQSNGKKVGTPASLELSVVLPCECPAEFCISVGA